MKVSSHRAFVITDLLSVVATIAFLVFLAVPFVARGNAVNSATRCMSNVWQLTQAWQLYASDYSGKVVGNYHGGDALGAVAAIAGGSPWASGWVDWTTFPDNTNILFIRNQRYAKLAPYILTPEKIHKCPSDPGRSAPQQRKGWPPRVRSVVMNGSLGHLNFARNSGPFDPIYSVATKMSDLLHPGPADTFVFLDEHPDSINDPFFFPPRVSSWIDLPSNLHNGGATFSFGDGHVELHIWHGTIRNTRVRYSFQPPLVHLGDPDIHWTSYHTQRVDERSY